MSYRSRDTETVEVCLLSMFVVLPIVFVPGLASLYRLPKQVALAVVAAVVLWGFFAQLRRERTSFDLPLFAPLAVYCGVIGLSLVGARNLYEGLVQSAQTLVSLGLFWTSATILREPASILRIFRWAAVSALIVSAIGIAQAWGADIPGLVALANPASTFGNVNMSAQYVILVMPAALALFLLGRTRKADLLSGATVSGIATYLTYTGTRAAWGGALVAAVLLSWLLYRRRMFVRIPRPILRQKSRGLAMIVAVVIIMNIAPRLWISDWGKSRASVSGRVAALSTEFQGPTSLRVRLAIWANTAVMIWDRPLLGVGKGNFQFAYPLYAHRVLRDVEMTPTTRIREAHNDYVQLAAEAGLVGLFAFVWLLVHLLRRFRSGLDREPDADWLVIGVASAFGLTALLAEAFFDFPFERAVPEAFFWVLAGIMWRAADPRDSAGVSPAGPSRLAVISIGFLACVATGAAAWGVNAVRAEYHYSEGGHAYTADRFAEADQHLTQAVELNPFDERYWFLLGLYEIRVGRYDDAARHLIRNLSLNPYNIGSLNNLGVALAAAGHVPEAIEAFQTSVRIWPDHIEAHNNLGSLYARLGERDLAVEQFETALKISPENKQARARLDGLRRGEWPTR